MGGKARQQQTSTTTTSLPGNQQQGVDALLSGALQNYYTGGPQYYPGQTYAGATPATQEGWNSALSYARGTGADSIGKAISANNFWMDPSRVTDLNSVPGYAGIRQGIQTDITRNLTENILPGVRGGEILSGQYGGTNQGIGEGLAVGRTNYDIGQALAGLDSSVYGQNLAANQNAIGRAPELFAAGLAPSQVMTGVGGQQQQEQQAQINDTLARYNFEQLRPLLNLQVLQSLIGTAGTYGGTNTTNTENRTVGGPGDFLKLIGGLLSAGAQAIGAKTPGG